MESNDLSPVGNFPFMKMPRQEAATSGFDKKCADLEYCILMVHHFFMWYGSTTKNRQDELRSVVFLDGLFLQMLTDIKEICLMRGKKLNNEWTNKFKDLLVLLNDRMRKATQYIRISNQCLEAQEAVIPDTAPMRHDIVEGFRKLTSWFRDVIENRLGMKRAEKLADELGLNYDIRMFGRIGDSFALHANMVLNGLMLLACRSMPDTQSDAFCILFDNSIDELQSSELWKEAFHSWKQRIAREYELSNIVEDKDKVRFLQKFLYALDAKEQALLERFDIVAGNTRSNSERAAMGFRIYEHLNGTADEKKHRMDADELQQYFLCVIQKRYIEDDIDRLKPKTVIAAPPGTSVRRTECRLFKTIVDKTLLAECFNEVYCRFYMTEDSKTTLEGDYKDKATLIAFLYIICKSEGYFENASMVPFFKFCTQEVQIEADASDRTFRNRVNRLKGIYEGYMGRTAQWFDEKTKNDFHKVLMAFHGTRYFKKLRQRMNG